MQKMILGGLVGTVVMTLMMYFVRPIVVGAPMDIAAEIGSQMGGNWWLGMAAHFMIGTVVIPLALWFVSIEIFARPVHRKRFPDGCFVLAADNAGLDADDGQGIVFVRNRRRTESDRRGIHGSRRLRSAAGIYRRAWLQYH